ncbi:hypothetical protein SEA_MICRODON_68 [Streptomyces phage Microdon]|nr:hypothetical protein SEA_MICRODON_68 [Streptomyces phage Microdon]
MSDRITIVDVRRQFTDRYIPSLQALGVPTQGLTLAKQVGHYELTDENGQAAPGVVGHGMTAGYIGSTAREAYATLQTIAKSLEFAGSWMVANSERVMR